MRSLKSGGNHKGPGHGPSHDDEHGHFDGPEPDELCGKMLCGQEAKECAEELGCFSEVETCKGLCQEGDYACYHSCKDALNICAESCVISENMCVKEGHPDADNCISCFNETVTSNSTYCDDLFEGDKLDKPRHKWNDDKEPDELCNKILCGHDAKDCADELGCTSELEICKDECVKGDHACYRTCKEDFEICATACDADREVCTEAGHPDIGLCVDCFNETDASNSTYCDDLKDWKDHGHDDGNGKGRDKDSKANKEDESISVVSGSTRSDSLPNAASSGSVRHTGQLFSMSTVVVLTAYVFM